MNASTIAADGALALQEIGLSPNARVLDVGTGKGNFAIYLASQGYRVTTGEPNTDTTIYANRPWRENARKAGVLDRIQFQSFDAHRLPFPDRSFDAVFFFGVLHHIDEAVRPKVFREALRVTKEDGAVVFFEPRHAMLEKIWVDDPTHPLAADPSLYLPDNAPQEKGIEGILMDVFIYRMAEALISTPSR
ncbi:MAG: class I SAM-dependent methyltransferase [Acidobacteriota bacterium]